MLVRVVATKTIQDEVIPEADLEVEGPTTQNLLAKFVANLGILLQYATTDMMRAILANHLTQIQLRRNNSSLHL